ncbi:MAG: patatin-like phospholipase family protein, partial [Rubrivivax sp.]|nr:patatin-like phospholipase family protein [Rubrivivax sp.]
MSTRQANALGKSAKSPARIGLALAGGGPLGAIYEIGALCALEEALPDVDLNALDGYVGVSAGAVVAAALANGMTPRQLSNAFIENDGPREDLIHPGLFFRPALSEYASRLAALPGLMALAGFGYFVQRVSMMSALELLGRALPTGLFSSAPLQAHLKRIFSAPGRSDDFRQLARRLVLVATDLDSGESAPFGLPGWDHVPISQAVAASAALPGLFPPVTIEGRSFVDGALKKTLHARVLLDMELDLVLCLNPLVPFDASHARGHRVLGSASGRIPHLVDGGLPVVLSQTFRALIHSRLEQGMKGYESSHPGTDIVLLEPDHRDPEMFLANTFAYSQRRLLAEHAYQHTRADLRSRRSVLGAMLAHHGLRLDDAVLDDHRRTLVKRQRRRVGTRAARALRRLDEVLKDLDKALA